MRQQLHIVDEELVNRARCGHSEFSVGNTHTCRVQKCAAAADFRCEHWMPFMLCNPLFPEVEIVVGES